MKIRKVIALILLVFVLLSSCITIPSLSASSIIYGDANNDSSVDVKDLIRVKRFLAAQDIPINTEAIDVEGKGAVMLEDLVVLRKLLMGIITYSEYITSVGVWLDGAY